MLYALVHCAYDQILYCGIFEYLQPNFLKGQYNLLLDPAQYPGYFLMDVS